MPSDETSNAWHAEGQGFEPPQLHPQLHPKQQVSGDIRVAALMLSVAATAKTACTSIMYFDHTADCRDSTRHRNCAGRWRGVVSLGFNADGKRAGAIVTDQSGQVLLL